MYKRQAPSTSAGSDGQPSGPPPARTVPGAFDPAMYAARNFHHREACTDWDLTVYVQKTLPANFANLQANIPNFEPYPNLRDCLHAGYADMYNYVPLRLDDIVTAD